MSNGFMCMSQNVVDDSDDSHIGTYYLSNLMLLEQTN